jgi:hypothetical protein
MDPRTVSLYSLIEALGDSTGNSLKSLLGEDEELPHPQE